MEKDVGNIIDETARRSVIERMWLAYYNDTLLQKGMITPDQHRKMKVYISTRLSSSMER